MRAYFILTLMFGLVVSFQNCSQKHSGFDSVADNPSNGPAIVQKQYDLSLASSLEITSPAASGLLGKSSTPALAQQSDIDISYSIDLANGHIEEQDETQGTSELKYCLTTSEIQEMKDVLYSSAVCKAMAVSKDNSACIAIYKAPYAVIHFPSKAEAVSLGEQKSGCDIGPDLCGQQASMLKGFLVHILQNLSSHSCTE